MEATVAARVYPPQQHGVKTEHSTIDDSQEVVEALRIGEDYNRVVLFVTLAVRYVFNSARCADMLWEFEHTFHIPS